MAVLSRFLRQNREEVIRRWREAILGTFVSKSLPKLELVDSLPLFLDEVARVLEIGGPSAGQMRSETAREHGGQRLRLGFDVHQVVREYGVLRDVVIGLIAEQGLAVPLDELRRFNAAISAGTEDAVEEYARQRDLEVQRENGRHLAFLAHELRNPLQSAKMALELLTRGQNPARAVASLQRNLGELGRQLDQSILQVRLAGDVVPVPERIDLPALAEELTEESALDATERNLGLSTEVPPGLTAHAERRLVRSALSNLLRNAIKFSKPGGAVVMRGRAGGGRVFVEVEDSCGGLAAGVVERVGTPFLQLGADRSGFGLGLAISKQVALMHGGSLTAQSLPGKGCVFVLELPQELVPPSR